MQTKTYNFHDIVAQAFAASFGIHPIPYLAIPDFFV